MMCLETLLERYEHSDEVMVLTNIVQTLGVLVLQDDIISMVCQDPGMLLIWQTSSIH